MKEQKRKLSWFQKVILSYITLLGFLSSLIREISPGSGIDIGSIAGGLGGALAIALIVYFFMRLFNKYLAPRINVTNKTLKKSWLVIQIITVCLIAFWLILFIFGPKIL